jgi:hypothetical protein
VRTFPLAIIALAMLGGCATIIEGTGQSIGIATSPPGATCTVTRAGITLGQVASTPGSIRIDKSKDDLQVTCGAPGYQTATIAQSPSFSGTTFGNIIAGGVVGAVVDASSGANYYYPPQIVLTLPPAAPAAPQTPYYYPQPAIGPAPRRPGV